MHAFIGMKNAATKKDSGLQLVSIIQHLPKLVIILITCSIKF